MRNPNCKFFIVLSITSIALASPSSTCGQATDPLPTVAHVSNNIKTNSTTQLGRPITVALPGLKAWSTKHDYHTLRLYLAGNKLSLEEPTLVEVDQEYVNFYLNPRLTDPQEKRAWLGILEEARRQYNGVIPISVGPQDQLQPFESREFISLTVYPQYTYLVVALLCLLLLALLWLGYSSDLLRDGKSAANTKFPFSLGRVQMAWWFYLVIAAYLYLWLVTAQTNMITPSVLALIGISSATGLAAAFVDQQKLGTQTTQRVQLEIQQAALQARIQEISQASPLAGSSLDVELQAKRAELATINASHVALPTAPAQPLSKGLIDILRDGDGISFYRFQIVVWSIIFGLVFIKSVLTDLTMPDFDSTLLGLMGLSSGTYIGFKFPEAPK